MDTDLSGAKLGGAWVYGISAWDLALEGAEQNDLVITPPGVPAITVDNLEVAQFIYLLLTNGKLREVIDTVCSKVVLILGRFTPERMTALDAIRNALRGRDYLPVLFDVPPPDSRDLTETISILAHLACFVIADITDARSIPQELERIVPSLPSVPVQPILQSAEPVYGLFGHLQRFPWVMEIAHYANLPELLTLLDTIVLPRAEKARATFAPKVSG